MSNELAIATVTAALSQSLSDTFAADQLGFAATVTTVPPNAAAGHLPTTGANVFLFLVTPNAAHRNVDVPGQSRATGATLRRPTVAIDLHYLISFYGTDDPLEPQILLGSTVRMFQERPVLPAATIQATLTVPRFGLLAESDLADAREPVRFTPAALSLEEMSKLWSVVFQTPYVLSVVYQAGVILIDRDAPVAATLPVRQLANVRALPLKRPVITGVVPEVPSSVSAQLAVRQPIFADSVISLLGRQLLAGDGGSPPGALLTVQIDGQDVAPTTMTDDRITLPLPATLAAGVHGVQVLGMVDFGSPASPPDPTLSRLAFESNLATFVVRPRVEAAVVSPGVPSTLVTITVTPPIGLQQRLRLLLNQVGAPAGQSASSYSFDVPARAGASPAAPQGTLTLSFSGVTPGDYLVRVQVDGVQSAQPLGAPRGYVDPVVSIA